MVTLLLVYFITISVSWIAWIPYPPPPTPFPTMPLVLIGHVAAVQKRSHQWCVSLTPSNTKTLGRMTCHCFLRPISRDLSSSSYTTHMICYCSKLTTRLSFSLAGNKLYALLIPIWYFPEGFSQSSGICMKNRQSFNRNYNKIKGVMIEISIIQGLSRKRLFAYHSLNSPLVSEEDKATGMRI